MQSKGSATSTSPKHSLAERLNRSRRHRQWAKSQLDTASVGGASVSSTGNASTNSEPALTVTPHVTRIRNRVQLALAHTPAPSTDNGSPTSQATPPATPSPDKQRESLAQRRARAMNLQKKRGGTTQYPHYHPGASKEATATPKNTLPPPAAGSSAGPPKDVAFKKREEAAPPSPAGRRPPPVSVLPSPPAQTSSSPPVPEPASRSPPESALSAPILEKTPRTPASRPRSPCESVQYQASAMGWDEAEEEREPVRSAPPNKINTSRQGGILPSPNRVLVAGPSMSRSVAGGFRKSTDETPLVSPVPLKPAASLQAANKKFPVGGMTGPQPVQQYIRPTHNTNSQQPKNSFSSPPSVAHAPAEEIKEGFNGAIIETPRSASVSSLRASFNSSNSGSSKPLMPMNSSDPRIRHSIGLVGKATKEEFHHVQENNRKPTRPSPNREQQRGGPREPPGRTERIERGPQGSSQYRPQSSPNGPSEGARLSWQQNRNTSGRESTGSANINGLRPQAPAARTQGPSWQNRSQPQSNVQSPPASLSKYQTGGISKAMSWQDRSKSEASTTPKNNSWKANRVLPQKEFQEGPIRASSSWQSNNSSNRSPQFEPQGPPKKFQQSWKSRPQHPSDEQQVQSGDAASRGYHQSRQNRSSQPDGSPHHQRIPKQAQPWQNRSSHSRSSQDLQTSSSWQSSSTNGRAPSPMDQQRLAQRTKDETEHHNWKQQQDWRDIRSTSSEHSSNNVHEIEEDGRTHEQLPGPPPQGVHGPPNLLGPSRQSLGPVLQPALKPFDPVMMPMNETLRPSFDEQRADPAELSPPRTGSLQPEQTELSLPTDRFRESEETEGVGADQQQFAYRNEGGSVEPGIPCDDYEYDDYDYEQPDKLTTGRPEATNIMARPPTYRPPSESAQNQKPWGKQQIPQNIVNGEEEFGEHKKSDEITQKMHEDDYMEEKKSGDEVLRERDTILDDQLAHDPQRSTYLTQMAADSTLIADYEEAIKHISNKLSYDEEDESYISAEVYSSALPRDLPPEFQKALAKENQPSHIQHLRVDTDSAPQPRQTQHLRVETEPEAESRHIQHPSVETEPQPGNEMVEQITEDEEGISPTRTTPHSERRYPRLPPSPKDNESYRMVYYGEASEGSMRGQRRRSPEKGDRSSGERHITQKGPLQVEKASQNRESLAQRVERMHHPAPPRPHNHHVDEQDDHADATSYESPHRPPHIMRSPLGGPDYLTGSEFSESESSPGYTDESTDLTSADEMNEGRYGGAHQTQYADPRMLGNQPRVGPGIVFGNPDTYGAAGVGSGGLSPSIRRRGTALEHWRGGQDMPKSRSHDARSPAKAKASASQILKFWTSGAASEEEQEEAQSFQDTEQWVDRDPDIAGFREEDDASPPPSPAPHGNERHLNTAPSHGMPDLEALKGWRKAPSPSGAPSGPPPRTPQHEIRDNMTPSSRAWVGQNSSFVSGSTDQEMKSNKSRSKTKTRRPKEVFDPFGDSDDQKISNSSDLFSPLPDPFLTEESFSPPTWDTPTKRVTAQPYPSPDWSQTSAEI